MTSEQQRIKIAELDGWKWEWRTINGKHVQRAVKRVGNIRYQKEVFPDYPNDLNAMHEAEKFCINETNEALYRNFLVLQSNEWKYHRTTASQRAKALLRTLGLWEE
jgi:hypothetical protein